MKLNKKIFWFEIILKNFNLELNKKNNLKIEYSFTSSSGFSNRSLMISLFPFFTARYNIVLLKYEMIKFLYKNKELKLYKKKNYQNFIKL